MAVRLCIQRSLKPLKDHQKRVVDFLETHHGLLVYHRVGSGKTLTAIAVSQCYLDRYPDHKVIVITPAGLVNNFRDEMRASYANIRHWDRYCFYSYQKYMNLCKEDNPRSLCNDTLLIIDEAHNLRTLYHKSLKGKEKGVLNRFITGCAKTAHKILLLSGTPLYNSTRDVVALYNMIRPEKAVRPREFRIDDMKCLISYRGQSNDNFPERIDENVDITMTPEYEQKYDDCIQTIQNGNENPLVKDLYGEGDREAFYNVIRRAVNNLENRDSAKIRWILRKIRNRRKTIVFSHFLDAGIRVVMDGMTRVGIPFGVIEGRISMKRRKQVVEEFNDDRFRVLFLSRAGGEGLDLKGVRQVIIMEPSWNQATEEQVIGRAIRYGSHAGLPPRERSVVVYHLYHIRKTDVGKKKELEEWWKDPTEKPPLDPYIESYDLYMQYLIEKKQRRIKEYDQRMKELSIEENRCP